MISTRPKTQQSPFDVQQMCVDLDVLGVELSSGAKDRTQRFAELLLEWNSAMNLTALKSAKDIYVKHFLDSFAVDSFIRGTRIIDIGSGAGFPGIPAAIADQSRHVVLLDSSAKKTQFLRHVVATVGLTNVEVIQKRIQDFSASDAFEPFDTVLVRALGSLKAVAELAFPLLKSDARVMSLKGKYPHQEIKAAESLCQVSVFPIAVPGLNAERHLAILTPKSS